MRLRFLLLASALIGTPTVTKGAPANSGNVGASQSGLQDIAVKAERPEESPEAALAVTAVPGDAFARQSITKADDLTRIIPSLQVTPAGSLKRVHSRGIGAFGANAFAGQRVAFNPDGIYVSRLAAPAALFQDLDRIGVLKGPQSALYGHNASGRAITMVPAKPKLNAEPNEFLEPGFWHA